MRRRLVSAAVLLAAGCGLVLVRPRADQWSPPVEPARAIGTLGRESCAQRDPLRQAFFGDLHVHTAYSFDARSRGMLSTPDDAYRFARGEPIGLGPFDDAGVAARTAQLERPLDFAAVTDHAEWIGEVVLCTTPGSESYDSEGCQVFRGEKPVGGLIARLSGRDSPMLGVIGLGGRKRDVCGPDSVYCRDSLESAWRSIQRSAERWYDRTSACEFTTFVGWEHSYSPSQTKVHRNVIFRNQVVPELPISSLEEPEAVGLWERLAALCNDGDSGCEALTIPHNPNASNGRLLRIADAGSAEERLRRNQLRARLEPLVEMMQVKGESECAPGLDGIVGEDELCGFEKIRATLPEPPADCGDGVGTGAMFGDGCLSRFDFVRYAVAEGMRERRRSGVNPLRIGFVGSTDTHNATPGDVEEHSYQGCCANLDSTLQQRLGPQPDFGGRPRAARNPGGLMGVWAEENSRDSLFDAMQRRETFATSGPRLRPRFFGGWEFPADLCDRADLVERGYAEGVAMGGILPAPAGAAPVFVAAVARDPGAPGQPGGLLDRLQIVKVWPDDSGDIHQRVFDVAGRVAENRRGAAPSVDLATCAPRGEGADQLCAVWTDPEFDPALDAAYYARVVENPSCRWSWRECLAIAEAERPAVCSDPLIPRTIQERAWTSPIWFAAPEGR